MTTTKIENLMKTTYAAAVACTSNHGINTSNHGVNTSNHGVNCVDLY